MKSRWFLILLCLTLLAVPAAAQESTQRDPSSLAARYLNVSGGDSLIALPDPFEMGVTTSQFWTAKQGEAFPQQINAVLAAGARVSHELPGVLLWVEEGVEYDEAEAQSAARTLAAIFGRLALRSNYAEPFQLPGRMPMGDPSDLMPVPDVDRDGFIHVLYMRDLADERDAFINPVDELPAAFAPGEFGNAREAIFVNTTPYLQAAFDDPLYLSSIATAFTNLLLDATSPAQTSWVRNLMVTDVRQRLSGSGISAAQIDSYLDDPSISITRTPTFADFSQINGGQQLFLTYLRQRFGERAVSGLFEHANVGIAALDLALVDTGAIDPVTGAPPTAVDVFADFAVTNIVNALFGDGRFAYTNAPVDQGQIAAATEIFLDDSLKTSVLPYGLAYYYYTASEAQNIEVHFEGAETINRFGNSSDDLENSFYLADQLPNVDVSLTRSIDLTGVDTAELSFDALYDLANGWNYGYVSVSTDDGETWQALPVENAEFINPHGVAYGPGLTGVSNPEGARPFPIMGVVLGADGVTISDLSSGGPAQQAGIRVNDVLRGVNSELWETAPNILDVLADYAPGDTLIFNVQRGSRRLEIPVELSAHPTRTVLPDPEWMSQMVDLTPYAGQEILLRFEMVTLPAIERITYAVDNLAIDAIDWHDDGESLEDWDANGWLVASERVPAEWLLTTIHTGAADHPPRVERVLMGDQMSSDFRASLSANETLILIVSALNTNTTQPAAFEIELTEPD